MRTVATAWCRPHMPIPNTVPRYFARVPPDKWQHAQLIHAHQPGLPPSPLVQDTQGPCGSSLLLCGVPWDSGLHLLPGHGVPSCLSAQDPQNSVGASLLPSDAPLESGHHTMPGLPPLCQQQQQQRPGHTISSMTANHQGPRVESVTRSVAPVRGGPFPLAQSLAHHCQPAILVVPDAPAARPPYGTTACQNGTWSQPLHQQPTPISASRPCRSAPPFLWRGRLPLAQCTAHSARWQVRTGANSLFWAFREDTWFLCTPRTVVSTFIRYYLLFLREQGLWTGREYRRMALLRRKSREQRAQRRADEDARALLYQGGAAFTGNVLSSEYSLYLRNRPPLRLPSRLAVRKAGGQRRSDTRSGRWRARHRPRPALVHPYLCSVSGAGLPFSPPRRLWCAVKAWRQGPWAALAGLGHLVTLHQWLHPRAGVG